MEGKEKLYIPTTSSIDGSLRFPIRVRAREPGADLEVRIMLFLGLDPHWTNRSREKPHSRSGTLASTACSEGGGDVQV